MAMILSAFVPNFRELLFDFAKEKAEMLFGVRGRIKKLEDRFQMISKVLADEERKRDNDDAFNGWLKELKDVMYDIDDTLDLCHIEDDNRSGGPWYASLVRCRSLFHFGILKDHHIGMKIREHNQKFEELWRRRSGLTSHDKQEVTYKVSRKTSPVGEIDIVGSVIEKHTQRLVDLLIKDDRRRNIFIFAIVGVGGIGKTTLAKKIYNNQRIQKEFLMKRWICVTKDFDQMKLLEEILDGNEKARASGQSKSSLEPKVESNLRCKKLFLVLDDVWTEKVWWDLSCNTLKSCATGSRILVTTRNVGIAKQMFAEHIQHVDKLSLEDGWSLLCKRVVLTGEEGEIRHLKDIGMKIVDKCGRLPLAIQAIAKVLCTKEKSRSDWNEVLESTARSASWLPEEVKEALYSSYEDLPSYLKQCFRYFSLFPAGCTIFMDNITRLWIAEGFVKAEGCRRMEEIAEGYYDELIGQTLLKQHSDHEDQCQMHDLLHCLARYLARDEIMVVTNVHEVGSSNRPMKLRRVNVRDHEIT